MGVAGDFAADAPFRVPKLVLGQLVRFFRPLCPAPLSRASKTFSASLSGFRTFCARRFPTPISRAASGRARRGARAIFVGGANRTSWTLPMST